MGGRIAAVRDEFLIHLIRGQGYVVTDARGKYLTEPSAFRPQVDRVRARMQAEEMAKRKVGTRACLCCQKSFKSQGIHNRMCLTCRGVSCALGDPVRPQIARRA